MKYVRKLTLALIPLFLAGLMVSLRAEGNYGPPGAAEDNAQVDIVITVGGEGLLKTAIGIPALYPLKGVKDGGVMGVEAARILTSDLDFSSYFSMVSVPDLPPPPASGYSETTLNLEPYASRGAELIIAGSYTVDVEDNYTFDFSLIDVSLKARLGRVTYTGKKAAFRRLMHRYADEVLRLVTGERGPFETQIVFAGEQTGNREIYICDSDGENLIQITHNKSANMTPALSPDVTQIVYTSYVLGNPDLYILPVSGGKPRRLFGGKGLNYCPDWSAANNRIAFASSNNPHQNTEIYTINPDGSDLRQVTHEQWSINVSPSWSPDGKYIAFVSSRYGDKPQVLVTPANGGTALRISRSGGYNTDPTWSPIGWSEQEYLVAYSGRASGGLDILAVRLDKSLQPLQTIDVASGGGADEAPSFSPDGRFVVYSHGTQNNYDLYMTSLRQFKPRKITHMPGRETAPDWSQWLK